MDQIQHPRDTCLSHVNYAGCFGHFWSRSQVAADEDGQHRNGGDILQHGIGRNGGLSYPGTARIPGERAKHSCVVPVVAGGSLKRCPKIGMKIIRFPEL